jgi:hypothetical protein
MDAYSFSLALGAAGLGVMGLSGLAHSHIGHHVAGHRDGSLHLGHRAAGGRAHVRGHGGRHAGGAHGSITSRALSMLLSPRLAFSLLVGFGATGLATGSVLHGDLRLIAALVGAGAFERLVMTPLWNYLFRFESSPALTLETSIGDEARAATNFDADGNGVVALELDGQLVQLLGHLRREDRDAGVRVRAGDRVRIDEVDAGRNRCTVRRFDA